ncbi:MAG: phage baseplate assembly protein [Desulfobacterales bacterium]|nr:phage baseplate assembly protein [Desulfobacterales bacterium]
MNDLISRALAPLKRMVVLMISRAVVKLVNDDEGIQTLQVKLLADELMGDVERFQNYGFTSCPLPGAEGIAVFISGDRDHGVVLSVDDRRYRLKGLKAGEVALYTDEGDSIVFKRGNNIEVNTKNFNVNASEKTVINTKKMTVNAENGVSFNSPNVSGSGEISDGVRSMSEDRNIYNSHTHPGDSGGVTGTTSQGM